MNLSWKKTLGSIVIGVILYISIYSVHKDCSLSIGIITQDMILALGLFGIKTYSGLQSKKLDGGK